MKYFAVFSIMIVLMGCGPDLRTNKGRIEPENQSIGKPSKKSDPIILTSGRMTFFSQTLGDTPIAVIVEVKPMTSQLRRLEAKRLLEYNSYEYPYSPNSDYVAEITVSFREKKWVIRVADTIAFVDFAQGTDFLVGAKERSATIGVAISDSGEDFAVALEGSDGEGSWSSGIRCKGSRVLGFRWGGERGLNLGPDALAEETLNTPLEKLKYLPIQKPF